MTQPAAEPSKRRTQAERSAMMRKQLMDAARALFIAKGYAETGTPEIVAAAQVTRGALYHHFAGKQDLFKAVCIHEAEAVADAIEQATCDEQDTQRALTIGSVAYFDAMNVQGRAALLLLEAPAALGQEEAAKLTSLNGLAPLRMGLAQALPQAESAAIDAMADIMSAAFDRTALAIAMGGDRSTYIDAMLRLVARAIST